jgi:D-alanyl-D-alanine endopeptidase (penicillin-binding protein 7)
MNRHFTLLEWIVVFSLLIFVVIKSADAKPRHKQKHYDIPNQEISVMVMDVTTDTIVRGYNIDKVRGLASMTKLMTAMIALDHDLNMNRKLQLSKLAGSHLPKREYTRGELFHALLIRSDNAAAETLAADYPGGRDKFIRDMNLRAEMMGMYDTHFDDPSGLSNGNVSTASNVTQMVIAASYYRQIREISTKKTATILTQIKHKERILILHNTNTAILSQVDGIQISKTGYTNPAGFCVALLVEKNVGDEIHHQVIVVMGAKNPAQRVDTVRKVVYDDIIGEYYVASGI